MEILWVPDCYREKLKSSIVFKPTYNKHNTQDWITKTLFIQYVNTIL